MTNSNIIGHPLFQLNLMLWLSWPSHKTAVANPIFLRTGYNLSVFEIDIPISDEIRYKLSRTNTAVKVKVGVDVLLEHLRSRTFIPIECKRNSFGPDSSTALQARAYLSLHGSILSSFIGKPSNESWSSLLTYVTTHGNGSGILSTLQQLAAQLTSNGISTADTLSLEITHEKDGIYLSAVSSTPELPELDLIQPKRVVDLSLTEDPRLLYLIPYLPLGGNEKDDVAETVFREQIRLEFMTFFRRPNKQLQEHNLDTLILNIVPVWDKMGEGDTKRHIRQYVRSYLRELFRDILATSSIRCNINDRSITIPPLGRTAIAQTQRYLLSAQFNQLPFPLSGPLQTDTDEEGNEPS